MRNRINNEELIKSFNAGDNKAYNIIYEMYFRPLAYTAYRYIKDLDECQDVAICAIQEAFQRHEAFEDMAKLKAFLYICAANKSRKVYHYLRKVQSTGLNAPGGSFTQESIEAEIVRTEFLMEVYKEIENLPPVRKAVFKMVYLDCMSTNEVCAKFGMTRQAVYTNVNKALNDLRKVLKLKKLYIQ